MCFSASSASSAVISENRDPRSPRRPRRDTRQCISCNRRRQARARLPDRPLPASCGWRRADKRRHKCRSRCNPLDEFPSPVHRSFPFVSRSNKTGTGTSQPSVSLLSCHGSEPVPVLLDFWSLDLLQCRSDAPRRDGHQNRKANVESRLSEFQAVRIGIGTQVGLDVLPKDTGVCGEILPAGRSATNVKPTMLTTFAASIR